MHITFRRVYELGPASNNTAYHCCDRSDLEVLLCISVLAVAKWSNFNIRRISNHMLSLSREARPPGIKTNRGADPAMYGRKYVMSFSTNFHRHTSLHYSEQD
jgi:hypothetical protein